MKKFATCLIVLVFLLLVVTAFAANSLSRSKSGGSKVKIVKWENDSTCYPQKMMKDAIHVVRSIPGFGPVNESERQILAKEATRLSNRYDATISVEQLIAMRTMELAITARRSGTRAHRLGEEIAAARKRGDSVLDIAIRYKLPPTSVLRQILIEDKHSTGKVRAMVADPTQLPPDLAAEAEAIFAADLGSRVNADVIREESQAFENTLGKHLRSIGIKFKTEDEIRDEYATGVRTGPMLTPDYLITKPVRINGRPVRWIDAKNYPLFNSQLVAKGLVKQATKYTRAFGPGAMVFSGGLMCGSSVLPTSRLKPPLLLDGSHIS